MITNTSLTVPLSNCCINCHLMTHTPGSRRQSVSPSRKMSTASLYSEVSLPPWNLGSGRNTPSSYT